MGAFLIARLARLVRRSRRTTSIAALAALALAAAAVAGCGSSSSSSDVTSSGTPVASTGSSSADSSGINVNADQVLSQAFAGEVQPPPSNGPKAVRRKTVWLLTCLGYEGCQRSAKGITEAAQVLGWNLKVLDNKADPTTTISEIRQAISAHADGVIENPVDCPDIKSGLLAARAAGVPVIAMAGLDCNNPIFHGGQSLFAANIKFGGSDWANRWANVGRADADFVLALAIKHGIKNPEILEVRNDDQALQAAHANAFAAEIKAKCPNCTLDSLRFTIPQIGNGNGLQVYKSGILAHPSAQILYYDFDSQLPLGLETAIQTASPKFQIVCCGDGDMLGYKNLRSGLSTMNAYPWDWVGWAAADTLNRVFAGAKTFPYEGSENLYVDLHHNLPPQGQYAFGSYNYKAVYSKVWSGH